MKSLGTSGNVDGVFFFLLLHSYKGKGTIVYYGSQIWSPPRLSSRTADGDRDVGLGVVVRDWN